MPDAAPPPTVGSIIANRFRIIRAIGEGGMGAVYEVEHLNTRHRRALKLLHREWLENQSVVERFVLEASAAGHIGNPHVVETMDADRLPTGECYLLMELLQGEPLGAVIERHGALPLDYCIDVVLQACEGVEAAHEAGIIHRDLKPDNLFLVPTPEGRPFVKILDFGISKFDSRRTGKAHLTQAGTCLGTPFYMSPEQIQGAVVDVRTDVYALGVVFYECVTGHKPFVAEEVTALSVLIYTGQCRPVRELRPDVPEGLARVIARAMAGKREDRYPSAAALAEAIREPIVAGTGAQVWPPVRVRVRSSLNPPKETQRSPAPPPGSHDADLALGPTVQATGTERPPAPSPPGSGSTSIAGAVSMDRPLGASAAPSGPTRRGWMLAAVALLALGAAAAVGARLTRSTREIAPAPAAVVPAVQATPSAESIALQPAPSASSAPVQRVTARTPPPSASSAASLAAPASSKPSPKSRAKELGLRTDNPFAE